MRTEPLVFVDKEPEPLPPRDQGQQQEPQKSPEEIEAELSDKKQRLGWEETSGVAREWWEAFEEQNKEKTTLVITLLDELLKRESTIYEFFLSYVYSNSDSIEENLKFLDRMIEAYKAGEPVEDESLQEAVSYM